MPTSPSPDSPKILKGGIALINNETARVERLIALQYNPETLTRTVQIKGVSGESGDHVEALRLKGPPVETIKVEVEIDAVDLLEDADSDATVNGIHTQLAALETIVYPSSAALFANNAQAGSGSIEIAPVNGPLIVFIFGPKRILPVRITELSITEESFDVNLNPVRAKISLGMRVLTVDDLGFDGKGGGLFMTYLQQKEQLAQKAAPGTFGTLGITGI
jgi:hypothetical protein